MNLTGALILFFQFLLALLTLTFAFAIIIKLILVLFAVVLGLAGMVGKRGVTSEPLPTPRYLFLSQVMLSAVYAAFIAVVTFE